MTYLPKITARQVSEDVPVFDLILDGKDVGLLTSFPGEGIVFTVRNGDCFTTDYTAATYHDALHKARIEYANLLAYVDQDDYIPDEDGEIAAMQAAERRAEMGWDHEDFPF